jgi:hypothetical protein
MVAETSSYGVPTPLIDDHAAMRADPTIAGALVHATAPREVADTLTVGRRTRRGMFATGDAFLMRYQHRSPTR